MTSKLIEQYISIDVPKFSHLCNKYHNPDATMSIDSTIMLGTFLKLNKYELQFY
jgi:hypothetical protein